MVYLLNFILWRKIIIVIIIMKSLLLSIKNPECLCNFLAHILLFSLPHFYNITYKCHTIMIIHSGKFARPCSLMSCFYMYLAVF